ncbi:MAG: hypothetical protein KC496_03595 [Anaerolineae bacterium]|nr:hypothetical protein [Anaerolineae bacterium]
MNTSIKDHLAVTEYTRLYLQGAKWWEMAYSPNTSTKKRAVYINRAKYLDSLAIEQIAHKPDSVQNRAFNEYNAHYQALQRAKRV